MKQEVSKQYWLWKSNKAMFAYKEPRNEPGEIKVILYSEYEKVLKELNQLRQKNGQPSI